MLLRTVLGMLKVGFIEGLVFDDDLVIQDRFVGSLVRLCFWFFRRSC